MRPKPIQVAATCLALGLALLGCSRREGNPALAGAAISSVGSDTMVNLALAWAEQYAAKNPEIRIAVTGGGTGTGISALINGTAQIANASRRMKNEETELAKRRGIEPQEHVVARDAIAVIVHPSNPVKHLTIEQLSEIFSGKILNWRQVGGENRPIVRLSREVNSGTHVFFLDRVVRRGSSKDKTLFSMDTLLLPSSEGIITEVAQNPNAIGYDGLGYVNDTVKVVPVAGEEGEAYILPSAETVQKKSYPIARDLYVYTDRTVAPPVQAYLEWMVGPTAQETVRRLGFVPVR